MKNISKWKRCIRGAKKCIRRAKEYCFCILLAPTPADTKLCTRKYKREIKHAYKYLELADYYGGKYERNR